jgi:hypothetical protein
LEVAIGDIQHLDERVYFAGGDIKNVSIEDIQTRATDLQTMTYQYTHDEFAAFKVDEIEAMLDFDSDFFEAFTPASLRAWIQANPSVMAVLTMRGLLRSWAQASDDTVGQDWPGFVLSLSSRGWLNAMSDICQRALDRRPLDLVHGEDPQNLAAAQEAVAKAQADEAIERARARQEYARQILGSNSALTDAELAELRVPTEVAAAAPAVARAPAERVPVHAASFAYEDMPDEEAPDENLLHGAEQTVARKGMSDVFLPAARASQLTLPHIIMRSSLVKAGTKNGVRQVYTDAAPLLISRVSGFKAGTIEMSYVGEELYASDMETYAHLLRLAARTPLGERLAPVKTLTLLRQIGRTKSAPALKALIAQVNRLRNAELRIWTTDTAVIESWRDLFPEERLFKRDDVEGVQISFKLLGDLAETKSKEKGTTVEFSTEMSRYVRVFFGQKLSTWYSEHTYQELSGEVAKRLYLFYQSHDGQYDFTFDELVEYLGTKGTRKTVIDTLKDAHNALVDACFIKGWSLKASDKRGGQRAYVLEGMTAKRPKPAKLALEAA